MFGFLTRPIASPTAHPVVKVASRPVSWVVLAIPLVAGFEGLYTHPYRDAVGVLTVCYGATAADHVDLTRSYTPDECKQMLGNDLPKYDAQMKKCLNDKAYNDLQNHPHRHAALVSFVYNLGPGPICKGAVGRDLNNGNVKKACDDMLAYNRAGGRVLKGLVTRRQQEHALCVRDD